jgi:hypothetical protein
VNFVFFAAMSATLTIPAKQLPFPYAAAAIAAYTEKTHINIDDSATAINLDIDGSSINEEEAIVQILAKELGLSEDSEKVIFSSTIVSGFIYHYYFRLQDFLP